jgi:hypothetical protein
MGGIETVFSTASRNQTIVPSIAPSEPVQKLEKLCLTNLPVDFQLPVGVPTSITNTVLVNMQRRRDSMARVLKLGKRARPLVRIYATLTINDLLRKPKIGFSFFRTPTSFGHYSSFRT